MQALVHASVRKLRETPGVESVSAVSFPPPLAPFAPARFVPSGQPVDPGHDPTATILTVLPGYFETLRTPIVSGRAIAESDGVVTDVSDAEILEAKAAIDAAGVGCEPASAASVAGVRRLVREGVIDRGARVVALLTGHVLKDPGALVEYHTLASAAAGRALVNAPVEVEMVVSFR